MSRCILRQGKVAWVARITKQDGKGVGGRESCICINVDCRSALRACFFQPKVVWSFFKQDSVFFFSFFPCISYIDFPKT